ncbi:hypothetical protein BJ684DRAFT_18897 [Piptocephalis cylindrospora]|uniref:Uncharacterized protein n=1 Tax=Piptocephalis cylindrospora TaxID=1907219 RepID=A0A4P9Y6Q2_9FUNG|nr:hypothetical protein BJ684DRAFT_18897 [Piptocephalis cylindrospora]|eukprot:RKP14715.1 hypothetical protein BJ684DRAFT_18897 [Piptocephalis cylindrospora]
MHFSTTLLSLALAIMAPMSSHGVSVTQWSRGEFGDTWGVRGWMVNGKSACYPGNVISMRGHDTGYVTYCRDCTTSKVSDLEVIGGHWATQDTSDPPQWTVVSGGSAYPGKVGFLNKATKRFLGRCTSASCRSAANDTKLQPVVVYEKALSANNVWECVSLQVNTTINDAGVTFALLGGDGIYLAHSDQDVVPATDKSGYQLGLLNANENATAIDSRIAFTPKIISDVNE